MLPAIMARKLTLELSGRCREKCEQEVPGDAIPRRSDEEKRGAGLVGEQKQRQRDECARCDDGAKCLVDTDCKSQICGFDKGLKKCFPTPMTGATTGG